MSAQNLYFCGENLVYKKNRALIRRLINWMKNEDKNDNCFGCARQYEA